ncbi:MAG: efflux RND transporter periplasmic adaptor subunit [Prosthecobacter sp.]|uniref:efflux RND transporter periplasmic adaptor subunit n=1 Tax=Prosthecobacter sp. TaxID=1965333 RepID=UPI0025D28D1D|nr:efflux RND transporter periplasmic adaptor subunit [Prosthecobacter sp.]MCF7786912.1 efflux RND transporter periplasmic adaptor subunit [Prosthecobacter sp.]
MKSSKPLAPADLAKTIQAGGSQGHLKRNLILGFLVLALGGGAWFWRSRIQAAKRQVPTYVTEPLKRGDISLVITATGNLEPTNEVTVGSELSGITLEVFADINDRVSKGQPLVRLDTSKLTQQTESNRATVKAALARVALAEATVKESAALLARQQELQRISGGQVPSKAVIDSAIATAERAKADLLNTQAGVGTAEAQVRINENDLEKAIIKSPIDGIVLSRSIEPGQTVAASFTAPQLFVIAEKLERMILKVTIAEADIGRVQKGQKATFTVDAWPDRSYTAIVTVVSYGSAVTQNVVTYEADLEVSNDDLSLRPGMTATADISVAESKAVYLVPTSALRFNPDTAVKRGTAKKSFVQSLIPMPTRNRSRPEASDPKGKVKPTARIYVLRAGAAEAMTVKTGISDGRHTEISGEGLTEGLQVITRTNTTTP